MPSTITPTYALCLPLLYTLPYCLARTLLGVDAVSTAPSRAVTPRAHTVATRDVPLLLTDALLLAPISLPRRARVRVWTSIQTTPVCCGFHFDVVYA